MKKTTKKKADTKSTPARAPSDEIDALIAGLDDWRGRTLADIREMIRQAVPDAEEAWKWMGSPVWVCDGNFLVANAHKDKVKLTFPDGAALPDPKGVFNAGLDGKRWRAIDLRKGEKLDRSAFKALLRAAVAHRRSREGAKKKRR